MDSRSRRVVPLTPSRVVRTIPAIDAPVSSSTPATVRNTKMMCAPKRENSVLATKYSASPAAPPWWRK